MSRGLRQFLVVFILVCGIALAVLVVQVFIFGERAPEEELTVSESTPDDSETPPVESSPPDNADYFGKPEDTSPEGSTEPETTPEESPPAEGMERVSIEIPELGRLIVDFYTIDFYHDEREYGDSFMYTSPEGGFAELSIMLRADLTASDAPRFFDDSDSETPINVTPGGVKSVGRTGLAGQYVTATTDTLTYELWLVDVAEVGALAFVISYSDASLQQVLHDQVDAIRLVA